MQTAFIGNVPQPSLASLLSQLQNASGFISAEQLEDKSSKEGLGVIFCRLQDGQFDNFKNFITSNISSSLSLSIQEGSRLE